MIDIRISTKDDIAVKEITGRIPEASLKFICCDAEALSCSGYFYIFDGTKYIVHEHDMGRLTGVRELYSEEDCMWDMIKETILCSAYKKRIAKHGSKDLKTYTQNELKAK